ncbi:MAG TPA: hypothetical protein VJB94_01220 [Candidatus Nanoarchaeia archaeon]|nr:hypothetical protein [Candidatus Nanoarchaeia archaeon]
MPCKIFELFTEILKNIKEYVQLVNSGIVVGSLVIFLSIIYDKSFFIFGLLTFLWGTVTRSFHYRIKQFLPLDKEGNLTVTEINLKYLSIAILELVLHLGLLSVYIYLLIKFSIFSLS